MSETVHETLLQELRGPAVSARMSFESRWKLPPGTMSVTTANGHTSVRVVPGEHEPGPFAAPILPSLSAVGLAGVRVAPQDGSVEISFDLFEIMGRFLFEDFQGLQAALGGAASVARRMYYRVRPAVPESSRLALRRVLARAQRRAPFPAWPADTTVDDLQACVVAAAMRAAGQARLPMLAWWPGGKRCAVVLRHDVEGTQGLANIDAVRRIEESRGLRSLWNVVPERYPLDAGVLHALRDAGHEIGVHGLYHDGRLFENRAEFQRRAVRINSYLEAWASRAFAAPSAVRRLDWIAESLEIDLDTSVPTAEVIGAQPGGCCTVFPFFLDREIVELPMTMQQDHTLLEILREPDLSGWHENLRLVREAGGICVLTSHPDYLSTESRRHSYASFIDLIRGDPDMWIARPSEAARWWRERARSQLVSSDEGLAIEGPARRDGAVVWIEPVDGVGLAVSIGEEKTPLETASRRGSR